MDQVDIRAKAAAEQIRAVERQIAESRSALERSAAAGDPEAQHMLAVLLLQGEGYPQEPDRALALLVEAAQNGHTPSLLRLAELKARDPAALEEAAALWTEAAARGSPAAMFALARALKVGKGAPQDLLAARMRFEEAARLGFAPAMHEFGICLADGLGGPEDAVEGFAWMYASFCAKASDVARANILRLAAAFSPAELARARKRGAALAKLHARRRHA